MRIPVTALVTHTDRTIRGGAQRQRDTVQHCDALDEETHLGTVVDRRAIALQIVLTATLAATPDPAARHINAQPALHL